MKLKHITRKEQQLHEQDWRREDEWDRRMKMASGEYDEQQWRRRPEGWVYSGNISIAKNATTLTDKRANPIYRPEGYSIHGKFICTNVLGLRDLVGAPHTVDGKFDCEGSGIQSLKGAPTVVNGDFNVGRTALTSLVEGPRVVTGNYSCRGASKLQSLHGCPNEVGGFDCAGTHIPSLVGGPQKTTKDYTCFSSSIKSLEGAPVDVGGNFDFGECRNITSLAGISRRIKFIRGGEIWVPSTITHDAFGLAMIRGLRWIHIGVHTRVLDSEWPWKEVIDMMNQYFKKDDGHIFEGDVLELKEKLMLSKKYRPWAGH